MTQQANNAQCSCGETQFEVKRSPLFRGYCHCTICQEFNQSAFADISIFRANDVIRPPEDHLTLKAYRPPPAVQRGVCKACLLPTIEYMDIFPLPKLVIIPTANLLESRFIPRPSLHLFYNRRVRDINDDLPKHHGYIRSQLAFSRKLFTSLLFPAH